MTKVLEHIQSVPPYIPGKPIEDLERELGITNVIKLASNENPLGPSPLALEAIEGALKRLHRYPDGNGTALRGKLAERWNLDPACLVLGNGSDEIIDLCMRVFVGLGEEVLVPYPSFLMYEKSAQAVGGRITRASLKTFGLDLPSMLASVRPETKLIVVCQPNNPTGVAISRADFEWFIGELPDDVPVLLDEAYADFIRGPGTFSGREYLDDAPQLLTIRTFSKAYGLAGIRIGYGIGNPELITRLNQIRSPFSVNSLAQTAAEAALDDDRHLKRTLELTWEGLDYFYGQMKRLGRPFVPSQTNFLLIDVGDGKAVYEDLLREGVIVRPMGGYGLPEYIRVNVGVPLENSRFVESLERVLRTRTESGAST
ncbi:MAG: histidinol-phosphate transaminase [Deltaproteobacteria bacterium]|nr:histidinol-phosphate transaminase [Deltaproteobacteria bacterium]